MAQQRNASAIVPLGKASRTQAQNTTDTTTYNQSTITYNQTGYAYGGFYGLTDVVPVISRAANFRPTFSGSKTQQNIDSNTLSYNEPQVSYNDSRYTYGGLYGLADVVPIVLSIQAPRPSIVGYADIYTSQGTATPNNYKSIGPGFFMFITAQ